MRSLTAVIALGVVIVVGLGGTHADGPGHVYLAAEVAPGGGYTGFFKVGWTESYTTGCLDSMERGTVEWNSGTVE